jgi:hypothetical protein
MPLLLLLSLLVAIAHTHLFMHSGIENVQPFVLEYKFK